VRQQKLKGLVEREDLPGPYQLPKGWRWVKLGDSDSAEIIMGQSPPSSTYNQNEEGLPFYQGKADFGERNPVPRVWCKRPNKISEHGDILISVRAPVGPVNICSEKSCIGRGLAAIRTKKDNLSNFYLFYFLKSCEKNWLGKGSTFGAIKKRDLQNYLIPLPPLEEQNRIVAKIEELFGKTDKITRLRKEAVEEARALVPAALHEVFSKAHEKGWRWVKLGEIVEIWDKYRIPVKKKDRKSGPYPYCGANGIIDYVDGFTHDGEFILLAEDGGFYGTGETSAYLMTGKFWANNHVHILKSITGVAENSFLIHYMNIVDLTPYLTGATRPKLPQRTMFEIPIPLPAFEEQKQIVAYLEKIQEKAIALQKIQQKTEEELEKSRESILHKAFRGELTS